MVNKLKYFCKTHNKLCCAACISKIRDEENWQHKDCEISLLIDIKKEKEKIFNDNFNKLEEISKILEKSINQIKSLYEEINEEKGKLINEIQNVFTKLRTILNEREDKLISEVGEIYNQKYFKEELVRESEKLPLKVKKCLESGVQIKDKWNKENELSEAINCCIEFENNLNKIDAINQKINKFNSNKINFIFKFNQEGLEKKIKEFGIIMEKEEKDKKEKIDEDSDEKSKSEKSKWSRKSDNSEKSKGSRKSSDSSKKSDRSYSEKDDEDLD